MANPGPGVSRKKGKNGNKKHGRNKASCAAYIARGSEARNKHRNMAREERRQAACKAKKAKA